MSKSTPEQLPPLAALPFNCRLLTWTMWSLTAARVSIPAELQVTARISVSGPAPSRWTPVRIAMALLILNRPPDRRTVPSCFAPAGIAALRDCSGAAASIAALIWIWSAVPSHTHVYGSDAAAVIHSVGASTDSTCANTGRGELVTLDVSTVRSRVCMSTGSRCHRCPDDPWPVTHSSFTVSCAHTSTVPSDRAVKMPDGAALPAVV